MRAASLTSSLRVGILQNNQSDDGIGYSIWPYLPPSFPMLSAPEVCRIISAQSTSQKAVICYCQPPTRTYDFLNAEGGGDKAWRHLPAR